MQQRIIDAEGNQLILDIEADATISEIVVSEDGQMYEITSIEADTVQVAQIEVEEDWGE